MGQLTKNTHRYGVLRKPPTEVTITEVCKKNTQVWGNRPKTPADEAFAKKHPSIRWLPWNTHRTGNNDILGSYADISHIQKLTDISRIVCVCGCKFLMKTSHFGKIAFQKEDCFRTNRPNHVFGTDFGFLAPTRNGPDLEKVPTEVVIVIKRPHIW